MLLKWQTLWALAWGFGQEKMQITDAIVLIMYNIMF